LELWNVSTGTNQLQRLKTMRFEAALAPALQPLRNAAATRAQSSRIVARPIQFLAEKLSLS
jgi:hypothetical protein